MVMKRYILTCICCGIFAGGVLAQQQDSIAKMRDAAAAQDSAMQRRSQADTAYRVKFNAMKYSMQKRYQPKGMEFNNKKFLDNFFFGFWGGYNRIIPQGDMNLLKTECDSMAHGKAPVARVIMKNGAIIRSV